eukprot:gnl/MRDRNA2_/MRDRNA2_15639_c0_seq1.p1 gnl/MRDRNA2_/MRDRNA2_15639_c0~~gnl/MRDRNA2_/MRDRNA2_15639_c0_seq1.p1  ORF type:complete len:133 (+),score=21.15 gnl/MRDRNA2_/MRDRNA2_15639_c0_seq1:133-531(+)
MKSPAELEEEFRKMNAELAQMKQTNNALGHSLAAYQPSSVSRASSQPSSASTGYASKIPSVIPPKKGYESAMPSVTQPQPHEFHSFDNQGYMRQGKGQPQAQQQAQPNSQPTYDPNKRYKGEVRSFQHDKVI